MNFQIITTSSIPKTDAAIVFAGDPTIPPEIAETLPPFSTEHHKTDTDRILLIRTAGALKYRWIIDVERAQTNEATSISDWMNLVATVFRKLEDVDADSVTFFFPTSKTWDFSAETAIRSAAEAILLVQYRFDVHKTKKRADVRQNPDTVIIAVPESMSAIAETTIRDAETNVRAINIARSLINEPSSVNTPTHLAQTAREVADSSSGAVTCRVYDAKDMKRMGMGALLGVAQGSAEEPKFIELTYTHPGAKQTVVLAGKGITFDSGGISLKPTGHIETMKCDMAGAASVIGIFSAFSFFQPKVNVVGLIAATENMPSGTAIKPGDIVTAMNGKTIEILNTDAEGRLILADALSYAAKKVKPDIMIDLATLTGACVVALGEEIAGLFSDDETLATELLHHADMTGEALWRLPLAKAYAFELKSHVADIKNVASSRYGGAINGALFLSEFVPKTIRWAHLDIAGPAFAEKDTPLFSYGGTGYGIRLLLSYLNTF